MLYAVYIATTDGPVRIERLKPEAAPLSEVFVGRGVTPLGSLSAGFDNFMQPGRPPETAFGPFGGQGFRMDLSSPVESGESWQLAVFIACGLAQSGLLAGPNDAADASLCLTGRVDADLGVCSVGHLERKTGKLETLAAAAGHPVRMFVPAEQQPGAGVPGISVTAVGNALEVFDLLGLPRPISARQVPGGKTGSRVWKLAALCGAGLLAGLVYQFMPVTGWLSSGDSMLAVEQFADPEPVFDVALLTPPAGETCAAVHFGRVPGVAETVPVSDSTIRLNVSKQTCGLSVVVRTAARGGSLSTYAVFRGVPAAEVIGQPGEASLPVRFADRHEWSVMLPAQLAGDFGVTVFASGTTGDPSGMRQLSLSVMP
ncbi:MAG: hypothetical protein RIC36_00705 [Rhodospirillales bacterium]